MIIYMIINVIEERAYIGQTSLTLNDRLSDHWESATSGSTSLLHAAMRKWNDRCFWDAVVLQQCYDQSELDSWEATLINELSTREPGVGYNTRMESNNKRSGDNNFYRECGKKGAAHGAKGARPKHLMSEEELTRYREWGRQGAAVAKQRTNR